MARLRTKEEIDRLVPVLVQEAKPEQELSDAEKVVEDALLRYAFSGGRARTIAIEVVATLKGMGL
jgi:hypothetical protein